MSKVITQKNNGSKTEVKWPGYIVYLFIFLFAMAITVTVLGFINQPIYNNFRMMSNVQIAMITFESIMFITIPFYIYSVAKTGVKFWLIHSVFMLLSLSIFFVNIIGFILLPILVVGYMALKGKAKWYTKMLTGMGVLLLAPIYLMGVIFIVAITTILKDGDVRSYQIASYASKTDEVQIGTANKYNIATWNIGYAGTGSEMSYFYDEGDDGVGKYGKNWEIGQDNAHFKGVRQFLDAGLLKHNPNNATDGKLKYFEKSEKGVAIKKPTSEWDFNTKGKLDFMFMQEVDKPSVRSFYQDQTKMVANMFNRGVTSGHGYDVNFVNNLKVGSVPVPIFDPIQQVDAGVLTASRFHMNNQKRIWLKTKGVGYKAFFNLKRAINYTQYKVAGNKTLVMANVHMSAFPEDKEKRIIELTELQKNLIEWRNKGYYVIVGGDWNTDIANLFKTDANSKFPNKAQDDIWADNGNGQMTDIKNFPTNKDSSSIYTHPRGIKSQLGMFRPLAKLSVPFYNWLIKDQADKKTVGFKFAVDAEMNHASNRFVDEAWKGATGTSAKFDSKGSIIDGFLVSDNVTVNTTTTLQQGWHKNPYNAAYPYLFADSDHNPVIMNFNLK